MLARLKPILPKIPSTFSAWKPQTSLASSIPAAMNNRIQTIRTFADINRKNPINILLSQIDSALAKKDSIDTKDIIKLSKSKSVTSILKDNKSSEIETKAYTSILESISKIDIDAIMKKCEGKFITIASDESKTVNVITLAIDELQQSIDFQTKLHSLIPLINNTVNKLSDFIISEIAESVINHLDILNISEYLPKDNIFPNDIDYPNFTKSFKKAYRTGGEEFHSFIEKIIDTSEIKNIISSSITHTKDYRASGVIPIILISQGISAFHSHINHTIKEHIKETLTDIALSIHTDTIKIKQIDLSNQLKMLSVANSQNKKEMSYNIKRTLNIVLNLLEKNNTVLDSHKVTFKISIPLNIKNQNIKTFLGYAIELTNSDNAIIREQAHELLRSINNFYKRKEQSNSYAPNDEYCLSISDNNKIQKQYPKNNIQNILNNELFYIFPHITHIIDKMPTPLLYDRNSDMRLSKSTTTSPSGDPDNMIPMIPIGTETAENISNWKSTGILETLTKDTLERFKVVIEQLNETLHDELHNKEDIAYDQGR